jgi:uncharacterized alpha-E superfamily protein
MLSRTADHLYWMARYTERAENTARMLDVAVQTSMLPQSKHDAERAWRAMLGISELQEAFDARHDKLDAQSVLAFMVNDPGNGSSIVSCLTAARENARAVRGVLTTEVWETHNATWLELSERVRMNERSGRILRMGQAPLPPVRAGSPSAPCWPTRRWFHPPRHLPRTGRQHRAHPRREIPRRKDAGRHARHADPARILLLGGLLRSVAGFEIYRKVYRDSITPARVAELLMLRADMPRSLLACMEQVVTNLKAVRNDVSSDTERLAGRMHAQLQFARIEDILEAGPRRFPGRLHGKRVRRWETGSAAISSCPLGA